VPQLVRSVSPLGHSRDSIHVLVVWSYAKTWYVRRSVCMYLGYLTPPFSLISSLVVQDRKRPGQEGGHGAAQPMITSGHIFRVFSQLGGQGSPEDMGPNGPITLPWVVMHGGFRGATSVALFWPG
jgi:hypothetical protein